MSNKRSLSHQFVLNDFSLILSQSKLKKHSYCHFIDSIAIISCLFNCNCIMLYFCLGRIQSIDSRFYYAPGESYSTFARTEFKPRFLEDVLNEMSPEQRTKATETCKDNKECLFDFAVTGGNK